MKFIDLTEDNIGSEHICCAISDKKCRESYEKKKQWLKKEFDNGYRFYRLDERAKVFIEYGPSEAAWLPVEAENLFNINCFWVSGKYKKQGLAGEMLAHAEAEAKAEGRSGLMTVCGEKKFHFMSDGKWFQRKGFEVVDRTESGFVLLAKLFCEGSSHPRFLPSAKDGRCPEAEGLTVYYSNRCPFAEYHVTSSLRETAAALGLKLNEIKLDSMEAARKSPSPATIFSLFRDGEFVTTDISICMENRFRKHFKI